MTNRKGEGGDFIPSVRMIECIQVFSISQLEIHLPLYTFSYYSALCFSLGIVHILIRPKGTWIYSSKVQAFPILTHHIHSLAQGSMARSQSSFQRCHQLSELPGPPLVPFQVHACSPRPEASHKVDTRSATMTYSNEHLCIIPRARQYNPNRIFYGPMLVDTHTVCSHHGQSFKHPF